LLRNLLENAAMYLSLGGRVSVQWNVAGNQLELRVADEGEGVPENLRERIFEPFFRASRAPGGTGLGLGIARDIARAHGGDLVLCDAPGGATFLVTLPAERTKAAETKEKSTSVRDVTHV